METFNKGDVIQLTTDLNWNNKGDLAVVKNVNSFGYLDVTFEGRDDLVGVHSRHFRRVDLDSLKLR